VATLDLQWLDVFDETYRLRNVSRAAEKLGITQGAASTALTRLRSYYGDELFTRTSRGVLPTPRADALHPVVREIREQLASARNTPATFDPVHAQRVFRVCMTDLGEIAFLPQLLNHLQSRAPSVAIEAEKISNDTPRRLEEGAVDLAVGYIPQIDASFYQQVLFEQDFVCLVSRSHPRIRGKLTAAAYANERHVVVAAPGTGHGALVDRFLEAHGVTRHIGLRVPSFLAVAQIVGETELIATVPRHYAGVVVAREPIRQLPPPFDFPRYAVKQHWHARYHRDPASVWLRQTIAALVPAAVMIPGPRRPQRHTE
jgi:DNA-binding transcriptional LysR family regulator